MAPSIIWINDTIEIFQSITPSKLLKHCYANNIAARCNRLKRISMGRLKNRVQNRFNNDSLFHRLIPNSVARIIHLSSQDNRNFEQFPLVCLAAARLINEINPSTLSLINDFELNEDNVNRLSMREIVSIQLKSPMDRLISSLDHFEGCQAGKELSRQKIERKDVSPPIPKQSADSSRSNSRIGEGEALFRFFPFDPSQKKTRNPSFSPSSLSVQQDVAPIEHSAPTVSVPASMALPFEANRSHSPTTHESAAFCSSDGKGVGVVIPFPGTSSSSSFSAARRKKEKKKHPENEKRDDDDSTLNWQGFEF